jgi:hypothetical protein
MISLNMQAIHISKSLIGPRHSFLSMPTQQPLLYSSVQFMSVLLTRAQKTCSYPRHYGLLNAQNYGLLNANPMKGNEPNNTHMYRRLL